MRSWQVMKSSTWLWQLSKEMVPTTPNFDALVEGSAISQYNSQCKPNHPKSTSRSCGEATHTEWRTEGWSCHLPGETPNMQIAKALDQQENVPQLIKTKSIQISFLHKKTGPSETPMSWGIVVGKIRRNDHPHLIAWSLKDQQGLPEIAVTGQSGGQALYIISSSICQASTPSNLTKWKRFFVSQI